MYVCITYIDAHSFTFRRPSQSESFVENGPLVILLTYARVHTNRTKFLTLCWREIASGRNIIFQPPPHLSQTVGGPSRHVWHIEANRSRCHAVGGCPRRSSPRRRRGDRAACAPCTPLPASSCSSDRPGSNRRRRRLFPASNDPAALT